LKKATLFGMHQMAISNSWIYYKAANKIDIRDCIRTLIDNLIEYNNITS